jgi:Ca2+-transporting ATPase
MWAAGKSTLLTRAHIFSRLSPEQKLQVIQAFQKEGMNVAMVGDGLNDVLAMKVADVGIAMGKESEELARRTADLVIQGDDLRGILSAISAGRAFYDNLGKSLAFLITAHNTGLLSQLVVGADHPSTGPGVVQDILMNLNCFALATEPPHQDVPRSRPRSPKEKILGEAQIKKSMGNAALLTTMSFLPGIYGMIKYSGGGHARNLFVRSLSFNQLLHAVTYTQRQRGSRSRDPLNPLLVATLWAAAGAHLVLPVMPFFGSSVATSLSRLMDSIAIGACGMLSLRTLGVQKPLPTPANCEEAR